MRRIRGSQPAVDATRDLDQTLQYRAVAEPHRVVQGQHLDSPLTTLLGQIGSLQRSSHSHADRTLRRGKPRLGDQQLRSIDRVMATD